MMAKPSMKDFATDAGVTIIRCDKEWGGTYGYKDADHPNSTICGFRTEKAAYLGWANDTFGKHAAAALVKLLGSPNA